MAKRKEYPEDFEKVYDAFPKVRTTGRTLPFRSWERLRIAEELPDVSVILAAIDTQKQGPQWQAGFVPMLSTWLNQHRWEAEECVDIARQVESQHQQTKKEAFIERQQATQQSVLEAKRVAYEKLHYNLSKLTALRNISDHKYICEHLCNLLVYNDIILYCKNGNSTLTDAGLICDTLMDVYHLRFKGIQPDTETLTSFWNDYAATITVLLLARHGQGNAIDVLPSLITLSDKDCINMRKVVTQLADIDQTKAIRTQYNIQSFYSPDDWFCMYPIETILKLFPEVH